VNNNNERKRKTTKKKETGKGRKHQPNENRANEAKEKEITKTNPIHQSRVHTHPRIR
jgi:hypothetical protein